MAKILSTIKERVFQYIDHKSITKEHFYETTGISSSNFKGIGAKSELGGDKIIRILSYYTDINPTWLLLGFGEMFNQDRELEPKNWIDYKEEHHTGKYSQEALLRVGLRIDEVCNIKKVSYPELAKKIGFASEKLLSIISGNVPVHEELLYKINQEYPDISIVWLHTGKGSFYDKRIVEEFKLFKHPPQPQKKQKATKKP